MNTRLPAEELRRRWKKIRNDKCGASALRTIKKAGWNLDLIGVDVYTWPGIIAAIPSLPNRRAGSTQSSAHKSAARQMLIWLRGLIRASKEDCQIEARGVRQHIIYMNAAPEIDPARLGAVADVIEDLALHKRWTVTRPNLQRRTIAELRWTVRQRCGKVMDTALLDLLDAAFRAAGKSTVPLDEDELKKVELTERRIRMKARQKLGN